MNTKIIPRIQKLSPTRHLKYKRINLAPCNKSTMANRLLLAEVAGFADIYTHDYSGYFKDIKDYISTNLEQFQRRIKSPLTR